MTAVFDPIALIRVLAAYAVDGVLIGGLAGVLHGSPATTNDADFVPEPSPDNLARLSAALIDLEARLRVDGEPDGVAFDPHPALLRSMSMLNLTTRCGDLDLATHPTGFEGPDGYRALDGRAVVFDIDGASIKAASIDDIIRSKRIAGRPKDRAVLPILEALRDELADRHHG